MKMSANQVTVLSGSFAIAGGLMISSDSKWIVLLGAICFPIFEILDCSDGEVARYRKQGGVTGHYLDWYMHFVSSTALMIGLFLASREHFQSTWLLLIGLLAIVNPILDKTITNAGWTVICWTRLGDINNNNIGPCDKNAEEIGKIQQKSWLYRRLRFLIISPLQDRWCAFIVFLLASLDLLFYLTRIEIFDFRFPLLAYIGVIGTINLYIRVRNMVKTKALQAGYRRLFCPDEPLKLPKDASKEDIAANSLKLTKDYFL